VPEKPQTVEPLMGWTSTTDTLTQVVLDFATREEAIAYAERSGIVCEMIEPAVSAQRTKAYSDNFRTERKLPWSH
jgi:hypothetical protein